MAMKPGDTEDDIPTLGWEEEQWETLDQFWDDEPEDEEVGDE